MKFLSLAVQKLWPEKTEDRYRHTDTDTDTDTERQTDRQTHTHRLTDPTEIITYMVTTGTFRKSSAVFIQSLTLSQPAIRTNYSLLVYILAFLDIRQR